MTKQKLLFRKKPKYEIKKGKMPLMGFILPTFCCLKCGQVTYMTPKTDFDDMSALMATASQH